MDSSPVSPTRPLDKYTRKVTATLRSFAGVLEIRNSRSHGKAIRFEKTQARYLSRMVATPVLSFSAIRHHSNEHFYGFLSSVFSLP